MIERIAARISAERGSQYLNRLGWSGVDDLNYALRKSSNMNDSMEILSKRGMGILDRFDIRSIRPGTEVPFGYIGSRGYVDRPVSDSVLFMTKNKTLEASYTGYMSKKDRLTRSPGPYTPDPDL